MIWLINLAGLVLIAGIVWWFWLYKTVGVAAAQDKLLTVIVENGIYQPARIKVSAGQAVRMEFLRKDASPCAEAVIFPALNLSFELPVNKTAPITLPPLEPGKYEFHCQMKMYRGELQVGKRA